MLVNIFAIKSLALVTSSFRQISTFISAFLLGGIFALLLLSSDADNTPLNHASTIEVNHFGKKPHQAPYIYRAISSTTLPNLIQISDILFSGGTPIQEKGFIELKKLGVRTIISVDGAIPQISYAKKHNLRYIHIPIGYDGISEENISTFRSVFSKTSPPYYFHCHHGKHRGPVALAAALCANGQLTRQEAFRYLTFAGTSKNYRGLWNSITTASTLKKFPPPQPLHSISKVSNQAAVMANIEVISDRLKKLSKQQWQPDASTPDLTAPHQALLLLEQFKELPRTLNLDSSHAEKKAYLQYLNKTTHHASTLEKSLRNKDYPSANQSLSELKSSCLNCHSDFRN